MENQPDEYSIMDLDARLNEIINQLKKEGVSLQSFARTWFTKGDLQYNTTYNYGIAVCNLAEQLLMLRNRLCTTCKMQSVGLTMTFPDSDTDNKTTK